MFSRDWLIFGGPRKDGFVASENSSGQKAYQEARKCGQPVMVRNHHVSDAWLENSGVHLKPVSSSGRYHYTYVCG